MGTRARYVGGAAGAALLLVVLAGVLLERRAEEDRAPHGAYRGAINPEGMREYEEWLGVKVGWALSFLDDADWAAISSPVAWPRAWSKSPYRVVYSVPLIPDTGGSLQEGASGSYDEHFAALGRTLIDHGEADGVVRLGWEFNGDWNKWTAKDDPVAFVEYWRRIVRTMRALPGAEFKFDWCPSAGPASMPADRAYPGDEYVDYIGLDAYDVASSAGVSDPVLRWRGVLEQPFGLRWHRDFAREHGKPMTYPEWGLWNRTDGLGGGDNPYFLERMHEWIEANNVAYHMYFDYDAPDGEHRLEGGRFPRSEVVFRELFGSGEG